ncbi:MAG TPA: leucyl aminopeptidase [Rhabdochlamydiaceae bacterium]
MQLTSASSFSQRPSSDVLVLPFWHEDKKAEPACPMQEFRALYASIDDFKGKEGETLFLYKKGKESRIILLGLGKKSECGPENLRRAYASALKACRSKKLTHICVALPAADGPAAYPVTEGLLLANYSFDMKFSKEEAMPLVQKICLIGIDKSAFKRCRHAQTVVSAVNYARDLINGNADDVTAQLLSEKAKELEKESKLIKTTILDKKAIEKLGMGLILAVNRASSLDPAFIIVEYKGNPGSSDVTALVGKGITYDTGGLNLKTSSMETMKDDMSGGAVVLGTIKAAAALKLKVNIIGAIASTDNAIGPKSYKPGDVYRSYSGKTVEITNTDAEGRLVLADAVSYVEDKFKPSRIIDLATLTGAIVISLGEEASGLFSNNDELAQNLIRAGKHTHERLWQFPLYSEYKEGLKSPIADMRNSPAARKASSIMGALFIQEYIRKTPWAHLDIAGTAFLSGPKHYHTTNATGFGVRLLVDYLIHHEKNV